MCADVAGTVSYCSPELLKDGKLTKAADVYSFAMMMWEIYTGTALFRGLNSSQASLSCWQCFLLQCTGQRAIETSLLKRLS